eukprot:1806003-Rhodomonas_salina.1
MPPLELESGQSSTVDSVVEILQEDSEFLGTPCEARLTQILSRLGFQTLVAESPRRWKWHMLRDESDLTRSTWMDKAFEVQVRLKLSRFIIAHVYWHPPCHRMPPPSSLVNQRFIAKSASIPLGSGWLSLRPMASAVRPRKAW